MPQIIKSLYLNHHPVIVRVDIDLAIGAPAMLITFPTLPDCVGEPDDVLYSSSDEDDPSAISLDDLRDQATFLGVSLPPTFWAACAHEQAQPTRRTPTYHANHLAP